MPTETTREIDLPPALLEAVQLIQGTKLKGLAPIQKDNLRRIQKYLRGMRLGTNMGKPGRPRLTIEEVVIRAVNTLGPSGEYFRRHRIRSAVGNLRKRDDVESEVDRLVLIGTLNEVADQICLNQLGLPDEH